MERKLKFRAWDETHKIMHYNFQFIKSGDEGNDWIVFTSDKQKLTDKPHPLENPYFSQQLKIMQFTGLHDKNGKEIYEGDILSGEFVVVFYNGSFGFWVKEDSIPEFFMLYRYLTTREIIGNIYENPLKET